MFLSIFFYVVLFNTRNLCLLRLPVCISWYLFKLPTLDIMPKLTLAQGFFPGRELPNNASMAYTLR